MVAKSESRENKWISLREFARRHHIRHRAVQKAIESGRVGGDAIMRAANGRLTGIDPEIAEQQWARNTDPIEAAKSGKTIMTPFAHVKPIPAASASADRPDAPQDGESNAGQPPVDVGDAGQPPLDVGDAGLPPAAKPGDDPHGFYEARARKAKTDADNADLDYLRKIGQLVMVEDVQRVQFELFRRLRDNMMLIPDRLAPRLAAETDPMRVHHLLAEETRKALSEFSSTIAAEAAAGSGVREHALP